MLALPLCVYFAPGAHWRPIEPAFYQLPRSAGHVCSSAGVGAGAFGSGASQVELASGRTPHPSRHQATLSKNIPAHLPLLPCPLIYVVHGPVCTLQLIALDALGGTEHLEAAVKDDNEPVIRSCAAVDAPAITSCLSTCGDTRSCTVVLVSDVTSLHTLLLAFFKGQYDAVILKTRRCGAPYTTHKPYSVNCGSVGLWGCGAVVQSRLPPPSVDAHGVGS
jgi:hypothetical protein